MPDTIGELRVQTRNANTFRYNILCVLTCTHNSKTTGRMLTFHISNDCSTIGDVYFSGLDLDARYEWWGTPPKTHCSLFPISHFCMYNAIRHITWKLQVISTTILSEKFFVCFRLALEIQLESYGSKHEAVVLWYMTLYAYTASL